MYYYIFLGNDIADNSANVFDYYTRESVSNSTSNSKAIKFYAVIPQVAFDCILDGLMFFFFFFI
jgi:hypothetical protein